MAAPKNYVWKKGDFLWRLCQRELGTSGYTGTVALKEAIIGMNPALVNTLRLEPGTIIYIPAKT